MKQLRQRMIDAMRVTRLERTQSGNLRRGLLPHGTLSKRDPAEYSAGKVQAYLLHLVRDRQLSYSTMNQAACAARFLFETVLGHGRKLFHIPMAKVPAKQRELLSRQEISRLFTACTSPTACCCKQSTPLACASLTSTVPKVPLSCVGRWVMSQL